MKLSGKPKQKLHSNQVTILRRLAVNWNNDGSPMHSSCFKATKGSLSNLRDWGFIKHVEGMVAGWWVITKEGLETIKELK